MKFETLTKIDPEHIGELISEDLYLELVKSFRTKFPTESQFVTVSRAAIEGVLNDGSVSGIKFMNGLENANDPSSRILVLIPGNYTVNGSLPNSIIKKQGYVINTGAVLSLEKTWQALYNHVVNYKRLDPAMHYTKINRGSFFGRNILNEFLNNSECENFIFHFGYLAGENLPYKPIIQPADGMKMLGDQSMPCPGSPGCPPPGGSDPCAVTYLSVKFAGTAGENQLAVLRSFRDRILNNDLKGVAIEKYYTISATLIEAIDNHQNKEAIFKNLYENYLKPSVEYLNQNDETAAYRLFTEVVDHLSTEYIFQ